MTDTAPQALAEIAKGLSDNMRDTLVGHVRHSFGQTMICVGTIRTCEALNRRGLLDGAVFTPLGLALRSYLMSNSEGK